MKENKTDSIEILLRYWREYCPENGFVDEADVLYDMTYQNGTGITNSVNINYIADRLWLKNHLENIVENGKNISAYYKKYRPVSMEYDEYVIEKAAELQLEAQPGTIKYLLSHFIANTTDSVYYEIQKDEYKGSVLQESYKELEESYYKTPSIVINIGVGVWFPTGDLKILGVKPEVMSLGIGVKRKRSFYNLEISLSPRMKSDPFVVHLKKTGEDVLSEKSTKIDGSLGYSFDFFKIKRSEFKVLASVGFSQLSVYDYPRNESGIVDHEHASTLVLSAGIGYSVDISSKFSIGINARYNYCDYASSGRVDLKGNSVTLQILFNIFDGDNKYFLRQIKSHHVDY